MNTEVLLVQNYGAHDAAVKCEFCLLTFRTSAEKNIHVINHFQQQHCSFCQQNLIRIGDTWYKEHSEHLQPKTEPNIDEDSEFTTESFVVIKPSDEVHENCIPNYSDPVFIDEVHPTFIGVHSKTQAEDELMDTDAESAFATENVLQPEQIILPEFIEQKPKDILHIEFINENESNEHVNDSFVDHTLKIDIVQNKIQVKPYKCGTCDETFAYKRNLNRHAKRKNHIMESDSLVASRNSTTNVRELSEKDFDEQANDRLVDQRPKNDTISNKMKRFQCPKCSKVILHSNYVKYHMNVCNNLKPYECASCDAAFADKRNLIRHTKRKNHTMKPDSLEPQRKSARKKSGKVSDGTAAVTQIQTSNDKIDEVNIAKRDDPNIVPSIKNDPVPAENGCDNYETKDESKKAELFCEICDKQYMDRSSFRYHMNKHRGIEPYICNYEGCGKSFSDRRRKDYHQQMHLERIECKFCKVSFTTVSSHKKHQCSAREESKALESQNVQDYDTYCDSVDSSFAIDWLCEYCNEDFEFEIRLAKHITKHHNEEKREHPCNICEEIFSRPHDLLLHMRSHPEIGQYKCTFAGCEQGFAVMSSLGVHMDKHTRLNSQIERRTHEHLSEMIKKLMLSKDFGNKEDLHLCDICNKKFLSHASLLTHLQWAHTDQRLKCSVDGCDKIFKTETGVVYHMRRHHPNSLRTCDVCQKEFYTDEQLAKHRSRHQNQFACNLCDKKFLKKSQLRDHLRTHEKDATCNVCGEKFASNKAMVKHRQRHGKKRIFTCRFKDCNQVFEDRRGLIRHSSTHPDSEKKKFICSYCGNAYASISYLKDHINTHKNERPFECKWCKKCFAKNNTLRRHTQIHTGEKPYKCDIDDCGQAYRDSIDLKRHKFSVHNIYTKKHICPICEKVFPERKLLTKHTINTHGKIDSTAVEVQQ